MAVSFGKTKASSVALTHISELTGAKVRIFLSEIAEGVTNYRSMHSLTQQVEHQYHGRFLIELLQNAHDALTEPAPGASGNRVEIVFDPTDSAHGSLLVANDGEPFSPSNFERLSQLGQSDKDPQKSIGNKGIGFRSVLEICESPEIYSRSEPDSPVFDGYCFAFRPDVVKSLAEPIIRLSMDGPIPVWFVTDEPLVDNWSGEMLAKFRKRAQSKAAGWLAGETHYLSPYLLPVPINEVQSARVNDFESRGFATVVRLPLKSADLRGYVLERMEQLSGAAALFLDKIGTLRISRAEGEEKSFVRQSSPQENVLGGVHVVIAHSGGGSGEYWVWSKSLHVPSAPQEFRKAVAALPGRWPEISDITVSVAVRLGNESDCGRFNIYLPTLVPTGSAVHINAPFFGDMSRTSIPFDDAYNRHLLETATDLCLEVVRSRLAGRGETEARAIVDFLAPFGTGPVPQRWLELLDEAQSRASASLCEEPLVLAESGWEPLNLTSLIPSPPKITLLTEEVLRRHATFRIFHRCLDSRLEQIKALAAARFPKTGAYPLESDLAETIAAVAAELHANGGDWNTYWRDVTILLPTGQAELAKHAVLLGGDGALHCVGQGKKVFFIPRQGTEDDSDIGGEGTTTAVPSSLQSSVAFLDEQIQLYDPNRSTIRTAVRGYLGQGLVSQFRVETIFSVVLQQQTPPLPARINGEHSAVCRDILGWAMRLMANVVARGRGTDATLKLLRTVPVPCEGGWFPMQDASFSDGWAGSIGKTLSAYLKDLTSEIAREARQRQLLPPGHTAWGDVGPAQMPLLIAGGVVDGLRLIETKPNTWSSLFHASFYDFELPGPPPIFDSEQWAQYVATVRTEARPSFSTHHPYEVGSLHSFPGMSEYQSLGNETRSALCELILQSLPIWEAGLKKITISKQGGQWNRLELTSPLKHFLRAQPWLVIREGKAATWARPSERWFVPADTLAGRSRHFGHLKALPPALARIVGQRPELATHLRELGMQFFDPHGTTSDPGLLIALTAAVGSDEVSDPNVLLGQIRDAWQRFRPATSQPPIPLVAVRRRDKQLCAVTPTDASPVYLPDSGTYSGELEEFDFPVVAIGTADAKDLREWFVAAYGAKVQLTSGLSLAPHVHGAAWSGFGSTALTDSDLGWLVRPLLVMVAQGRGIHSQAFNERHEILRSARIDWVPNLSVAVMRGELTLANTNVVALWEPTRKTLVVTDHCRTHLEDLSDALSQAIERDDLELPLRYVLRGVDSVDSAPEDVAALLAPLRITPDQVHQVLEHLRGDVGHMARFVSILLAVVSPNSDSAELRSASTEEELAAGLAASGIPGLDVHRTLQVARESHDLFDFGRSISLDFGESATLARWNLTLAKMGQSPLSNRNWSLQLQASLEEVAALVKRLAAHALRQGTAQNYAEICRQYQALATTTDLSRSHWIVGFPHAMHLVERWAESWLNDPAALEAVHGAESPESLRLRLTRAGVLLDLDPDECGRKNNALVDTVARGIDRLRLAAWLSTSPATAAHDDWRPLVDEYRGAAAAALAGEAFTSEWSEQHVVLLLRQGVPHPGLPQFQAALDASKDLASLQASLGLSSQDIENAQGRLDAMKAERIRRKSIVKVCGENFDGSDDNLGQLWGFLSSRISDEELAKAMPFNLAKPMTLAPFKRTTKTQGDTPKSSTGRPERQSKAVEELIGLAGEIHVFRMLRQQYGEDAVPSSAWISENSRRVFTFNQADDTRGCDFAFTVKGRQYRVEVKASAGDDETFKLGSSEIRLAMEIGTKGKRRREVFVLVHVKNALSPQPSAVALPNPYDPKHTGMFSIEEADARVRYRARN
ncbi:sacsin N-terminal ATP-binding-like domain-containing protein [Burkholderia gladioli]|uniref:sacsin N-terminal ATP-binding-like domain-containing protein n=1 Tax=Burkholderia gladioli TaxID=28095 RepID=UPI002FE25DD9